jgi:hypothetical protein
MTASSLPAAFRAGAEVLYAIGGATALIIAHGTLVLNDAVRIPEALYRRLEERLVGARDTNRFLDKRIADLEARILVTSHRGQ